MEVKSSRDRQTCQRLALTRIESRNAEGMPEANTGDILCAKRNAPATGEAWG